MPIQRLSLAVAVNLPKSDSLPMRQRSSWSSGLPPRIKARAQLKFARPGLTRSRTNLTRVLRNVTLRVKETAEYTCTSIWGREFV